MDQSMAANVPLLRRGESNQTDFRPYFDFRLFPKLYRVLLVLYRHSFDYPAADDLRAQKLHEQKRERSQLFVWQDGIKLVYLQRHAIMTRQHSQADGEPFFDPIYQHWSATNLRFFVLRQPI